MLFVHNTHKRQWAMSENTSRYMCGVSERETTRRETSTELMCPAVSLRALPHISQPAILSMLCYQFYMCVAFHTFLVISMRHDVLCMDKRKSL